MFTAKSLLARVRGDNEVDFSTHSPNDVPPQVMNYCTKLIVLMALLITPVAGCQQPVSNQGPRQALFDFRRPSPFGGGQSQLASNSQPTQIQTRTPQEYQAYSNLSTQINDLNQRVGAFDIDNQQLHTEIAGLKQKLQLANEYNLQLKQQLSDNASRFQQFQLEKSATEQQLAASQLKLQQFGGQTNLQSTQFAQQQQQFQNQQREQFAQFGGAAPTRLAGTATVRANNSLMNRLNQIQIPGGQARMDGDVIRIEFPSDQIFVPGTYQIQPAQAPLFQNLVTTIRQSFPRQIIGVEAHWDNTPLAPAGTTHHQLTATQALAIFDNLVRLGLAPDQLFTMAMGSNRPRHPQGTRGGISPNRRIEIVIYPETYDSSDTP